MHAIDVVIAAVALLFACAVVTAQIRKRRAAKRRGEILCACDGCSGCGQSSSGCGEA